MRIFGRIVLVLGIAFELLFTIVCLGGGEVSPTVFGVGASLIVTGWRLRNYGRGIPQCSTSLAHAAVHASHSGTVELPITQAVASLISREIARSRRVSVIVIAAGMSFFLLIGAIIQFAVPSPWGISVFPFMALTSLAFGLIVGGICVLSSQRPARRDLRESTFLRTSGPVQLVPLFGGYLLKLIDRSFLLNSRATAAIMKLRWATVDYSKHAHLIFAIRDHSGKSVYKLSEYEGECSLQDQRPNKNLACQLVQCTVDTAFTMFFEPWMKRRTALVIFLSSDQEGSRTRITALSRKEQTVSIQLAYGEAEFNLKGATLSYGNSEIDGEYANCKGKCGLLIVQLSQRTSQLVFAEPSLVVATTLATVSGNAMEAWANRCGLVKD